MGDTVSVIIPTFRRPGMVRRAVASVLVQTYQDIEIIVVNDDQSTSVTFPGVSDPRLRVVENRLEKGACGARNFGISVATGRFVTGLDDDDLFESDRIESLVRAYDPSYSLVASNVLVHSGGRQRKLFKRGAIVDQEAMLWGNYVGSQMLTERYKIIEVGGFDITMLASQDADLWTRMIVRWGPAIRLSDPLYVLELHDGERISNSRNKVIGLQQYYNKYSSMMTPSQRRLMSFKIAKYNGDGNIVSALKVALDPSCLWHLSKKFAGYV